MPCYVILYMKLVLQKSTLLQGYLFLSNLIVLYLLLRLLLVLNKMKGCYAWQTRKNGYINVFFYLINSVMLHL